MQFVNSLAGGLWSFLMTYAILFLMNKIPGLELRVDAASARLGLDKKEIGESAYERIASADRGTVPDP